MSETKPIDGITLKHLALYLPYGLKAVDEKNNIIEVYGINSYSNFIQNIFAEETLHFQQFKLLLRPLSDLTKEELRREWFWHHIDYLTHEKQSPLGAPFEMVQYLLSKHFDVFGLIDRGLAVNINDIQK